MGKNPSFLSSAWTTISGAIRGAWSGISSNPQNFANFLNFLQGRPSATTPQTGGFWSGLTGSQTGKSPIGTLVVIGALVVGTILIVKIVRKH